MKQKHLSKVAITNKCVNQWRNRKGFLNSFSKYENTHEWFILDDSFDTVYPNSLEKLRKSFFL